MSQYWEQSANDLRVFLEDHQKSALEDIWDLQRVLTVAYRNRFLSRNIPYDIAHDTAVDEAISVVSHLDTLRPILEAYWKDHPVGSH